MGTYGVLPVGYTGYYYTHPYVLYGRKKREADAEPHADSKADADALAWYGIHGYWPVGYTGYYYTHDTPSRILCMAARREPLKLSQDHLLNPMLILKLMPKHLHITGFMDIGPDITPVTTTTPDIHIIGMENKSMRERLLSVTVRI